MSPPLDGTADARFGQVREVFTALLADGAETGAAVAVFVDGELVVDLWGGWADAARRRPWARDTIAATYSVTKWPAALCVLRLVDDRRLALDDTVASVWPEYAVRGKDSTTIRHLLAHQAGLPAFPEPRPAAAWGDWDDLVRMLAAAEPRWQPGTVQAEHALTFGHLLGEVVRRVDGRSIGRFWREEVAGPFGLDFWIGLPAEEQRRCAEMEFADPSWPDEVAGEEGTLRRQAFASPAGSLSLEVLNSPMWRGSEIPAVNGHGTARAVARLYAATAGQLDGPLLSPELLAAALAPAASGPDLLLERDVDWGLGLQLEGGEAGMGGVGGSYGSVDLVRGYAIGYVTRRLHDHDRAIALAETVEACL